MKKNNAPREITIFANRTGGFSAMKIRIGIIPVTMRRKITYTGFVCDDTLRLAYRYRLLHVVMKKAIMAG